MQLREALDAARSMPLSASVMLNRDEFGEILQDAIDGLPEELRQARWLLKERDEVLERAAARSRADHRRRPGAGRADGRADRGRARGPPGRRGHRRPGRPPRRPDAARGRGLRRPQARRFEVVLDRTMQQVAKGRERLSVHAPAHEDLLGPDADEAEQAFFDQDDA